MEHVVLIINMLRDYDDIACTVCINHHVTLMGSNPSPPPPAVMSLNFGIQCFGKRYTSKIKACEKIKKKRQASLKHSKKL